MTMPVLDSYDQDTRRTSCSGRLGIKFPASASAMFGGETPAAADVHYTIQPAADGNGVVYALEGAGAIIQAIASADLSTWVAHQSAATSTQASLAQRPSISAPPTARSTPAPPALPAFDPEAAIRADAGLAGRRMRLAALLENAEQRDTTGRVQAEDAAARRDLNQCENRACVQAWFGRREAALRQWAD